MIGIKQAQITCATGEVIYRRDTNTSINLMKGQRSKCTEVQGLKRGSITPRYLEWVFQHIEVVYT